MPMNRILLTAIASALLVSAGTASADGRRRDQDAAYEAKRSGQIRSLREFEGRVVPRLGGASYLGSEFGSGYATSRLKVMRAGSLIWVDVAGRTGALLGPSG